MVKILRDIWILFNEGTVIFKRVFDEKIDAQLFGGFMSALNAFASQIAVGGMSSFNLGGTNYFLHRDSNLLFIVNSAKNANNKEVMKELDAVVKRFFLHYPKSIFEKWDGEIDRFTKFKVEIEGSLETPVQKLKDSFW